MAQSDGSETVPLETKSAVGGQANTVGGQCPAGGQMPAGERKAHILVSRRRDAVQLVSDRITVEVDDEREWTGNQVDVGEVLKTDRVEALKRRMRIRSVRLRKVAKRYKIPICAIRPLIEQDVLDMESIRELQLPYVSVQHDKD